MLSSTLEKIGVVIENNVSDQKLRQEMVEFMSHYKSGHIIYPAVLVQKFRCTLQESYQILNALEHEGLLESFYIYFCPHCARDIGTARVFNELPNYVVCDNCETEFSALEFSRLAFKVV